VWGFCFFQGLGNCSSVSRSIPQPYIKIALNTKSSRKTFNKVLMASFELLRKHGGKTSEELKAEGK